MINRLFQLARSNIGYFFNKKHSEFNGPPITDNSDRDQINNNTRYESVDNPLEKYFSNLELPTTASRKEVKNAWRHLMKKYHPDLHSIDPEKRKIATKLSQSLTEAYKTLDKELAKRENA